VHSTEQSRHHNGSAPLPGAFRQDLKRKSAEDKFLGRGSEKKEPERAQNGGDWELVSGPLNIDVAEDEASSEYCAQHCGRD
jgi:hypothetical protein